MDAEVDVAEGKSEAWVVVVVASASAGLLSPTTSTSTSSSAGALFLLAAEKTSRDGPESMWRSYPTPNCLASARLRVRIQDAPNFAGGDAPDGGGKLPSKGQDVVGAPPYTVGVRMHYESVIHTYVGLAYEFE